MIKLKSILTENTRSLIPWHGVIPLDIPAVSREQQMVRISQENWNEFLTVVSNKLKKTKNVSEDNARKLTYGLFGGTYLTPKTYDVLNRITGVQIETLNFYTDGNASTIMQRAKDLYNEFSDTYNAGCGQLKGQSKAKKF